MTEISVIIPIYNKQNYVELLLKQLMTQSFTNFECILIDDGSSDDSGAICDRFAKEDSRFQVFHIPNGGVSNARNLGLDKATGEYITFIDSDDTVDGQYLQNLYRCITKGDADIVISGIKKVWKGSVKEELVLPSRLGEYKKEDILNDFVSIQYKTGIYGTCVAKIFKKSLTDNVRFDPTLKLAEDFDFYLRLYERTDTFYLDDKALYFYLQEADNSSVQSDERIDYLSQFVIQMRLYSFLNGEGAFIQENAELVKNVLGNYAFYTLRYASSDNFEKKFNQLYEYINKEKLELVSSGVYQRVVLTALLCNNKKVAKITISLYETIRRILRNE